MDPSENPAIVLLALMAAAAREAEKAPEDVIDIPAIMQWAAECESPPIP